MEGFMELQLKSREAAASGRPRSKLKLLKLKRRSGKFLLQPPETAVTEIEKYLILQSQKIWEKLS